MQELLYLLILIVLMLSLFVFIDYQPKPKEVLDVNDNGKAISNKEFTLVSWNIGYCAMDAEVDFFMDGGKASRAVSKKRVKENLDEIVKTLKQEEHDFVFLQEVDKSATRSFYVNQFERLQRVFKSYHSLFAITYKTHWVPFPLFDPMGKVLSGLVTFSKYRPDSALRYTLPGNYSLFTRFLHLDRCFIEERYAINGKELLLINLHLSAFDKGGFIREQQLAFLFGHIQEEEKKGNYVVIGGDWNSIFPEFEAHAFNEGKQNPTWTPMQLKHEESLQNWNFIADKNVPSCRLVDKPYVKEENFLYVVDGFLLSHNIKVIEMKGVCLEFKHSDHNPVYLRFELEVKSVKSK